MQRVPAQQARVPLAGRVGVVARGLDGLTLGWPWRKSADDADARIGAPDARAGARGACRAVLLVLFNLLLVDLRLDRLLRFFRSLYPAQAPLPQLLFSVLGCGFAVRGSLVGGGPGRHAAGALRRPGLGIRPRPRP